MEHLMVLDRCTSAADTLLPLEVMKLSTPLRVDAWRELLHSHPDRRFAKYIVGRLEHGFRIRFNLSQYLTPTKCNLTSTNEWVEEVTRYIEKLLLLGSIVGPLKPDSIWQIKRMGMIPKGHTPGKWHMITNLSHLQM